MFFFQLEEKYTHNDTTLAGGQSLSLPEYNTLHWFTIHALADQRVDGAYRVEFFDGNGEMLAVISGGG